MKKQVETFKEIVVTKGREDFNKILFGKYFLTLAIRSLYETALVDYRRY